ncbi:uncharacterized protein JCM10292_006459 [Rhodotorula paludigena]|uniref:uncharacterized protein n=1 Tax=Rhodotorula paludigena TaxID=86838 RepID=UPI003174225D
MLRLLAFASLAPLAAAQNFSLVWPSGVASRYDVRTPHYWPISGAGPLVLELLTNSTVLISADVSFGTYPFAMNGNESDPFEAVTSNVTEYGIYPLLQNVELTGAGQYCFKLDNVPLTESSGNIPAAQNGTVGVLNVRQSNVAINAQQAWAGLVLVQDWTSPAGLMCRNDTVDLASGAQAVGVTAAAGYAFPIAGLALVGSLLAAF